VRRLPVPTDAMTKLDERTTDHDDLRAGRSPWNADGRPLRRPLDADRRCDVLVVGAGITGAMAAWWN
jgi:NADPH-dependent 2,4-dienoyl-CoA reductase/sulfur reductase-like enzyme